MPTKNKKNITPGRVDVNLKDIQPGEAKFRVTAWIDEDVLDVLREQAKELGMGYQTLMNQKLREAVLKEKGLLSRLERIEKKVFGKKGA